MYITFLPLNYVVTFLATWKADNESQCCLQQTLMKAANQNPCSVGSSKQVL